MNEYLMGWIWVFAAAAIVAVLCAMMDFDGDLRNSTPWYLPVVFGAFSGLLGLLWTLVWISA